MSNKPVEFAEGVIRFEDACCSLCSCKQPITIWCKLSKNECMPVTRPSDLPPASLSDFETGVSAFMCTR
eukprot:2301929-Rhodomonas_salina.6